MRLMKNREVDLGKITTNLSYFTARCSVGKARFSSIAHLKNVFEAQWHLRTGAAGEVSIVNVLDWENTAKIGVRKGIKVEAKKIF